MIYSGLNNYQDELLTILTEECGETVQEICKINRFGMEAKSHHIPNGNHLDCLIQEIGDILAIVDLLVDSDMGITIEKLDAAKEIKLKKLGEWMRNSKPNVSLTNATDDVFSKTLILAKKELRNYKEVK